MTADEAMRVPAGPELDRLVAELVMGERLIRIPTSGEPVTWYRQAGAVAGSAEKLPPRSTDINEAMAVLCRARGEPPCEFIIRDCPGPQGGYLVLVGGPNPGGADGVGRGPRISEAICRAAVDKAMRAGA